MRAVVLLSFLALAWSATFDLVLLSDAPQKLGAMCLDGSAPAYYFTPGSGSGANKFYIHHQGGGWCTSLEGCYKRSQGELGSSKAYPKTMNMNSGYFSDSAAVNPTMYNWNKVYLRYCDGGSYSGSNATVNHYEGHPVYYRGFHILRAFLDSLSTAHKLNVATEVVISGCSAGGLATYLHLDWWAQHLNHAKVVKGLPDSGFFLDYDSTLPKGPKYGSNMRWVFWAMNASSGVDQDCIAANKGKEDNCFFAEHTAPHVKTPFFALQAEYDSWQSGNILGTSDPAELNAYGKMLVNRFNKNVLSNDANGAFLDSCYHHCGKWNEIKISAHTSSTAFAQWYTTGAGVFFQDKVYPCTACCNGGQ